ncbi:hypothetical protein [Rossellomorea yichunensis]|uniref:hypothetical protein n=1 Tax=Rossellomorea yichunensis TaxID=3077331 RepID=UPI0028DD467E|nr:hypothetical protein [Rossellomorea sp. YC4-1]MDT9025959.1 hypothetical protein [Rossellomorea sp. YC4-1]
MNEKLSSLVKGAFFAVRAKIPTLPQLLPPKTRTLPSSYLETLPIFTIIKPYLFDRIPFTKGLDGLYNPVVQVFTENQ